MPHPVNPRARLPRIQAADPRDAERSLEGAQQLLAALDGAHLGAWLWNINESRITWSRRTQALFGFDPDHPLPADLDYMSLLPEADRTRTIKAFQAAVRGEPGEQAMRHRIRWPDGTLHWIEISGSLTTSLDGHPQMIGVVRDISRQRERETALISSETRFATLFHLCPNVVLLTRRSDGLILEVNKAFEKLFGWSATQILNHTTTELGLWVDPGERDRIMQATQGSFDPHTVRLQMRVSTGRILDGVLCTQNIELEDGTFLLSTFTDISHEVEREQRLASSEEKFASLFQASAEPLCVTRRSDGVLIEINPSFTQTFGWHASEIIGLSAEHIGLWDGPHPRVQRIGELIREQSLTHVALPVHHQDGRLLTCTLSSRLINVDGQPCVVTTLRDITQQQRAEAALKASEEKFAKAFHFSPDCIVITERSTGRCLEVNDGFTRVTGYGAEQAIGCTLEEMGIWADEQQRLQLTHDLQSEGRVQLREVLARNQRGEIITLEVSVQPITLNEVSCLLITARDISILKNAQAQIRHLAYHDPLTDLPNRALLMERLGQQVIQLQRQKLRGALLFLDLDHFKHINDSLGHPVGDAVLKIVTARLEASVRLEDTVARLGGDEFVVLISDLVGSRDEVAGQVMHLANTLRELLAEPMSLDGHRLQVTPSIGVALIPDHGSNSADLLKRADIALYRAKDSGRNTTHLYHNTMQKAASDRLQMENDLRMALARGELSLHYQPQVDAREDRIVGCEALLRWHHPVLGQQSPAQFIQVLEESGMILEVGAWVLDEACAACAGLLRDGLIDADDFSLCVNISPRQFRQADFVQRVERSLTQNQLPSNVLKLEITEGIVIQNLEDTIAKMRSLQDFGVSFAMDDFGTGYSSLTYLKRLPVAALKIDQSFVRDATHDPNDAEIIRAIVAMARSLDLIVIAEGVELSEQLDFLERLGCHLYQGYLHSRPMPLEQFRRMLVEDG